MELSANTILIIGYLMTTTLAVFGFMKMLRDDRVIKTVTTISVLIALVGLLIRNDQTKDLAGNSADSFFGPLIYIVSYALLRFVYKRKFHVEPTYDRNSMFDKADGRRQNWLDITVHVLPFFLSLIIPLLIE